MIRILMFAILLLLSLSKYKNDKKIFNITIFIYFVFLSLRCVQGLDYSSYGYYYNSSYGLVETLYNGLYFPQFGYVYNYLVSFFKTIHVPFEVFICLINLFVLAQFGKFIIKYSNNLLLSLLIVYSIYGISFIESALRQVIVVAILFGVLIDLIKEKKWLMSLIVSIVAFDLHPSSIIFIICIYTIFIDKVYQFIKLNLKYIILIMCFLCLVVNLIGLDNIYLILPMIIRNRISYYFTDGVNYSILAILLRIINLGLVIFIMKFKALEEEEDKLLYLYLLGIFIYFIFAGIPIFSRLTLYFEFIETIIFSYFNKLRFNKKCKKIIMSLYLAICLITFYKDCVSNIELGYYKTDYLPYLTIFQKEELEDFIDKDNNRMFRLYLSTLE